MKLKVLTGDNIDVVGSNGVAVTVVKVGGATPQVVKILPGVKGIKGDPGTPGIGNMQKSVYDINNDGIVDNSERLNGYFLTELQLNGGYF